MPVALLDWYRKLGLPINEGYGLTENLAVSHLTVPGTNQQGSVGPAYKSVEDRIDPDTGEIQMRSAALMMGYYKDPVQPKAAFSEDGWLRTGDKGVIDAQGNLHITGRVKDLFKTSKGKYVAPAPIEDKLVMHEAVEACVVSGANLGQPLGIVKLNPEAAKRAHGTVKLCGRAPSGGQHHIGPARAAPVHHHRDCSLDSGQRHHHADLWGQAPPHRGGLCGQLRTLGSLG